MPKFKVLRTVDAYVFSEATVVAATAEDAAEMAREQEGKLRWRNREVQEYDARNFVTLDEEGLPIDETLTGKLP